MGILHGKEGAITVDADVIAEVTDFKVVEEQEQHDANSMSNPDWERSVGGRRRWNGEISFLVDLTDTNGQMVLETGFEGTFRFQPEGATTSLQERYGTGRIESIETSVPHDNIVTGVAKVKGTGALSAWGAIA